MNDDALVGQLNVLAKAEEAAVEGLSILLPTQQCPPLPRLNAGALRDDWSAGEQLHIATCNYCKKTIALAQRIEQQEPDAVWSQPR